MRKINSIIVHCTATPAGRHVSVADISLWHRQRGFVTAGYHYVVYLDGSVHPARPVATPGAHCLGHNADSIGVCYVGGVDSRGAAADTRTPAQREALRSLLRKLVEAYPGVTIHGHRDFAAKACPCFDATTEYSDLCSGSV